MPSVAAVSRIGVAAIGSGALGGADPIDFDRGNIPASAQQPDAL
jgi:hypothetical protein